MTGSANIPIFLFPRSPQCIAATINEIKNILKRKWKKKAKNIFLTFLLTVNFGQLKTN